MLDDSEDREREVEKLYDKLKRETLVELHCVLVKDIDPSKHYAFLRSKRVLDADDEEEISAERTRRRRAELFLTILCSRGGYGFDIFCEALLQGVGQLHLLKELLECFDKKRVNKVTSLLRIQQPTVFSQTLPKPGEVGGAELPPEYYLNEPPPSYYE